MPRWLTTPRTVPWIAALALALAWSALILHGQLQAAREDFETQSRIVHRLLTQRAEQHDALLAALVAMQAAVPDASDAQWSAFGGSIAAAYPQVASIERAGVPIAGTGAAAGYALRRDASDGVAFALRIRPERLLDLADLGAQQLDVQLARGGGEVLWRHAAVAPDFALAAPFAPLRFEKHLDSRSQPYLVTTRQPAWLGGWPWARWLGGLAVLAALGALGTWAAGQARARRLAQRQLVLAHAARVNTLGEVASGIAHELNQPLAAILATSQALKRLLAEEPPDLAAAAEASAGVVQQAQRAGAIVHRLRDFIAPQAREPQAVDLNRVVQDALALVEQTLRSRRVKVALDLDGGLPAVRGEPVAFEQVVVNLLLNAADALQAQPEAQRMVRAATMREGASVLLRVSDTGPGLAAGAIGRVFEPFFTTKPHGAGSGLGLGLTICEHIVLQAGGSITAENASPRGAAFTVRVPALAGEGPA